MEEDNLTRERGVAEADGGGNRTEEDKGTSLPRPDPSSPSLPRSASGKEPDDPHPPPLPSRPCLVLALSCLPHPAISLHRTGNVSRGDNEADEGKTTPGRGSCERISASPFLEDIKRKDCYRYRRVPITEARGGIFRRCAHESHFIFVQQRKV